MGSELDKPLGQDRPPSPGRQRRLDWRIVCGSLAAILVVGGSLYAALLPLGIPEAPDTARTMQEATAAGKKSPKTAADAAATGAKSAEALRPQDGSSGANLEQTLTGNGLTVTKITPGQRQSGGPALITVGKAIGQDPAIAAEPDPELVEQTSFGKLPKLGPGGKRPMDVYARPASGDDGTRIAIVVGGLGLSQTGTMNAIETLPPDVTLAFAATGNSLTRWMQQARHAGHEILLQVPMQPFDYPQTDPGPHTLTVNAKPQVILDDLHSAMGRITNYTGVMNYLGGRFMSDADAFEPVVRDLAKRGLLFLDDGTASRSLTGKLAPPLGLPYATADVQLDSTLDRDAIMKRLSDLEDIARRKGSAIGVASAFDQSVDAIAAWASEAQKRGIEIVGVSQLVDDPSRKD